MGLIVGLKRPGLDDGVLEAVLLGSIALIWVVENSKHYSRRDHVWRDVSSYSRSPEVSRRETLNYLDNGLRGGVERV
jgi:hypothetical protein